MRMKYEVCTKVGRQEGHTGDQALTECLSRYVCMEGNIGNFQGNHTTLTSMCPGMLFISLRKDEGSLEVSAHCPFSLHTNCRIGLGMAGSGRLENKVVMFYKLVFLKGSL